MNIPSRKVNVAVVQHSCEKDSARNIQKAVEFIREAARQGAEIVCLQELFALPYFPSEPKREGVEEWAEFILGSTTAILSTIAKELHIVIIGGSIYERGRGRTQGKFFNTAPIIDADGKLLAKHRKAHIPQDPGYNEKDYFTPGDEAVTVINTKYGRVGVGICFDQWFPEVANMASRQGAEILFYPTAIGHTDPKLVLPIQDDVGCWDDKLHNALRGQAAMGNMYIGMANRIGKEGPTDFFGQSCIMNHNGEPMAIAKETRGGIALATCDLGVIPTLKNAWTFEENRRPELYR